MQPPVFAQGSVERVTYHNADNGYCVLKVKMQAHRDLVTVVGHVASVSPGQFIETSGEWIQHRDFGLQFKSITLKTIHPSTIEGIEKYLGSGMVKGIGPHFAKKLVEAFAENVFDTIENHPEQLRKVPGIGKVRIEKITRAWKDQKIIREIMVFLQSHGVSTSKAVRIYKTYGQEAVAKVTANPYQLAKDIHGIGFKSADIIAEKLGISKTSLIRARAGINHVLMERISDGHCAYPDHELIQESIQLLEIDEVVLNQALALEVAEGYLFREVIEDQNCLYPAAIYQCEVQVARLLKKLNLSRPPWAEIDAAKELPWVENHLGITLAPLQRDAVRQSLSRKILVITGGPGTGKTTLTRSIVSILKAKKIRMNLCSPTGRAAKRLAECTGMEAKTIHRLLGFDPKKGGFLHNKENPLPLDLLIIDEASMVDIVLLHQLLKAIPPAAALIIVGDVDQIPSVGPGNVLKSIIDSGVIPTVKLTQIFRQAAQSQIIQTAHAINQGKMPALDRRDRSSDFHFVASDSAEGTLAKVIELVKIRIPKAFHFDPTRDIQVLCPMNRGSLGGRAINLELQKVLNPNPAVKVERFGITFAPGDKVIVTTNDYDKEVFNGDIGMIKELDLNEQEAIVDFDGREVIFDFNELDILSLAYAISIHKSQGSEYPVVVIPLSMQHFMMLKRNLIYTGITRGKKLVILVGEKKALAIAVKSKNQGTRLNKLADRLRD
jgi:exodeoxyribonuclease V alpha subunit